jgi:hypothetical protein
MVKNPVRARGSFEGMQFRVYATAAYERHSYVPLVIREVIPMRFDHPPPRPCQHPLYPAPVIPPEEEAPRHRAPPQHSGAAYPAATVDPSRSGTSRCTPAQATRRARPCTGRAAPRPMSRMTRIWVETVLPRRRQRRDGKVSGDVVVSRLMVPGWCRRSGPGSWA